MIILLLILACVFIYFAKYVINHSMAHRRIAHIPGPYAWPFIGNMSYFFNKSPSEIFYVLLSFFDTYGSVCRGWIGMDLNILTNNASDIEALLISTVHINKGGYYLNMIPWLGTGLLLSTGKKWYQRRKVLTPAFHFKILEDFVEIFERQNDILNDILSGFSGKTVDLYHSVSAYTLDVICESAMGTQINAQRNSNSEYVKAVLEQTHIINLRFFDIFLKFDFTFQFSSYARRQKKMLKILHNFTEQVIRDRRIEIESNNTNDGFDVDEFGNKKKFAFLDILLKSTIDGKPLTDQDIREEVDTFMFEGHDTTTSGIIFTLFNIAKYPSVQKKCLNEIIEVLGEEKKQHATNVDFSQMNYLEKVIKESLRLFPPVPIIQRYLKEDAIINGKLFPRGANVVLHLFALGRNSKFYKDPMVFRPERFDHENAQEINTFAYLPFSAGPRNCIGQKFAMIEMKSVISNMVRNYHFSLIDDNEPILRAEMILRSNEPIMFHIEKR